ncbi:MAG: hypothetical protein AB7G28_24685 [Pirellulales bacterium]
MKAGAFGLLGLGFFLLLLSFAWSTIFPPTSTWTAEKQKHLTELKSRVHNLHFVVNNPESKSKVYGGTNPGEAVEEYRRLKQEAEELMAEFQTAHDRPQTIATALKWTGIALAGVGAIGWFATREA